jgi:hypothetical protein
MLSVRRTSQDIDDARLRGSAGYTALPLADLLCQGRRKFWQLGNDLVHCATNPPQDLQRKTALPKYPEAPFP